MEIPPPPVLPAPVPEPQPAPKRRVKVDPIGLGSQRLIAALCLMEDLKAEFADAKDKLDLAKKTVQAELHALSDPDDMPDVYDIPADPHGSHPAYALSHRDGSWQVNEELLRAEHPEIWERYKKQNRDYWEFRKADRKRS